MAKDRIELISRGLMVCGGSAGRGGWVLACRHEGKGYLYLPGGHVEFGESSEAALVREFREETGLEVRVGGCAAVCEVRFEQGGRRRHEVNLVFHVEPPHPPHFSPSGSAGSAVPPAIESLEEGIGFEWVALSEVGGRDFRPGVIRTWLGELAAAGEGGGVRGYAGGGVGGVRWLREAE